MPEAQLISLLFAVLAGLVGIIYGALVKRIGKLEAADNAAVLQSRVDALATQFATLEGRFEQRIKDRDKFDYEWRHGEYVNAITSINLKLYPLDTRVQGLEKGIDDLREWKHLTVDPYIPRAIDEHERRLNKHESKIFNGDRK